MNQKDYQKLKEIIWKANPSILELKLGCEVVISEKNIDFQATILHKNYAGNFLIEVFSVGTIMTRKEKQIIKILGRPITLCDVLSVVKTKAEKKSDELNSTTPIVDYLQKTITKIVSHWNLKQNSLDNQSKECKEFLIKLLVKQ